MDNQKKLDKKKKWERKWEKKFEEIDKEFSINFDEIGLNDNMPKDEQI